MNDGFGTSVFAIGVAQGVFLLVVLWIKPGSNRRATAALAAILAVFTAMILGGGLTQMLSGRLAQLVIFLNINTELAIGPLVLLWLRSILDPDRRWTRRDAAHLLPFMLGVVLLTIAWATIGQRPGEMPFRDLQPFFPAFMAFKACYLFTYLAMGYRTVDQALSGSRQFFSGRSTVEVSWLKGCVLVLASGAGLIYLANFVDLWLLDLPFGADPLGSLMLAAMIYLASLLVLLRPWILSLKPRLPESERWAEESAQLSAHLERERPWLEPELRLADLADAMDTSENRLSAVINEGLETTFYGLLARYRLAEFERLSRDPTLRQRSVLDLAFEAGFNSKASFYRIFRESHGVTPTAFRKKLEQSPEKLKERGLTGPIETTTA